VVIIMEVKEEEVKVEEEGEEVEEKGVVRM
jgi:hypothetical protein